MTDDGAVRSTVAARTARLGRSPLMTAAEQLCTHAASGTAAGTGVVTGRGKASLRER